MDKFCTKNELINLIIARNPKGHDLLYELYAGTIYGVINTIVKDTEQSSILCKKAFIKICNSINDYDPHKTEFITWVLQLARYISIDYIRSNKKIRQGYQYRTDELETIPSSIELILIPGTDASAQTAFELILQGYNANEIATKLSIPVETVKLNIRKAIQLKANRTIK